MNQKNTSSFLSSVFFWFFVVRFGGSAKIDFVDSGGIMGPLAYSSVMLSHGGPHTLPMSSYPRSSDNLCCHIKLYLSVLAKSRSEFRVISAHQEFCISRNLLSHFFEFLPPQIFTQKSPKIDTPQKVRKSAFFSFVKTREISPLPLFLP